MMPTRPRKLVGLILATLAAMAALVALEIIYLLTLGRIYILTGIPTPGGAPLEIHVLNMGIKGAWSAAAYAAVMHSWFGQVNWLRVALLWLGGLVVVAVLGGAAMAGLLPQDTAFYVGIAAYLATSLVIARDWVAR